MSESSVDLNTCSSGVRKIAPCYGGNWRLRWWFEMLEMVLYQPKSSTRSTVFPASHWKLSRELALRALAGDKT